MKDMIASGYQTADERDNEDIFRLYQNSVIRSHEDEISAYEKKLSNKVITDHFGKYPKKGPLAEYRASQEYREDLERALEADEDHRKMKARRDFLDAEEMKAYAENLDIIKEMIERGEDRLGPAHIASFRRKLAEERAAREGAQLTRQAFDRIGAADADGLCRLASDRFYRGLPEKVCRHFLEDELDIKEEIYGHGYGFWDGRKTVWHELGAETLGALMESLPEDGCSWEDWAYHIADREEDGFPSSFIYGIAHEMFEDALPEDVDEETRRALWDGISDEVSDGSCDNESAPADMCPGSPPTRDEILGMIRRNPRYAAMFREIDRRAEQEDAIPGQYAGNIRDRKITARMLEEALYSANKRAKNWRDRKREHRHDEEMRSRVLEGAAQYEEDRMYALKDTLLSVLSPICVHREPAGYDRVRTYSYEQGFDQKRLEHVLKADIVWANSYLDEDTYEEIWFFDYEDRERPRYRYYLYYVLGEHSFHTPISGAEAKESGLEIRDIGPLETEGCSEDGLAPIGLIKALAEMIREGSYELIGDGWDAPAQNVEDALPDAPEPPSAMEAALHWETYGSGLMDGILAKAARKLPPYVLSDGDKRELAAQALDLTARKIREQEKKRQKGIEKGKAHPQEVSRALRMPQAKSAKPGYMDMSVDMIGTLMDACRENGYTFSACADALLRGYPEETAQACQKMLRAKARNAYLEEVRDRWKKEYAETGDISI